MNRLTRAITVACLAGVAALVPAASAVASTAEVVTTNKAASAEPIPYRHGTHSCRSEQACVSAKRQFIREGYKVSKMYYTPPGSTCVDGCPGPHYFHYWKSNWK